MRSQAECCWQQGLVLSLLAADTSPLQATLWVKHISIVIGGIQLPAESLIVSLAQELSGSSQELLPPNTERANA